jgi:two-component system NarL family sensor kinase
MPALSKLSREFSDNGSLMVKATQGELNQRISADVALSVYRIAQEALHNIEKHSRAHHVNLHLETNAGRLRLQIVDDGVGFAADHESLEGLGIGNMRERAAAIGGSVLITSSTKGTCVEASIPLNSAA